MKKQIQFLSERLKDHVHVLLVIAIGLLMTSVVLQWTMCVALVNDRGITATKPIPVDVTNRSFDVNVKNRSDIKVKLQNHYIIDGDPIPVRIVD